MTDLSTSAPSEPPAPPEPAPTVSVTVRPSDGIIRRDPPPPQERPRVAIAALLVFLISVGIMAAWWWHQSQISILNDQLDAQTVRLAVVSADLAAMSETMQQLNAVPEPVAPGASDTAMTQLADDLASQAASLTNIDADLAALYRYVDDVAIRQQAVERIVATSPDFDGVISLLAGAVVQIETEFGTGSGFPIDLAPPCPYPDTPECDIYEAEGYDTVIITNFHVVQEIAEQPYEDAQVTVRAPDGSTAEGRVWTWDIDNDLALVDIDRSDLDRHIAPLLWAPADSAAVGDQVAIGGYPLGLDFIAKTGVISGESAATYQTDAIASAGNSGGPLVDSFGRVIGVVTAGFGGLTEATKIEALCEYLIEC